MNTGKNRKLFVIALASATVFLLVGIFAPLVAPRDPNEINPLTILLAPNREFWFGTDNLGRCVLSRVLYGARTSLSISLVVVVVSAIAGTFLGLTAAVSGVFWRVAILKFTDVLQIIPGLIFSLVVVGLLGTEMTNLIIALASIGWIRFAKTAYTVALSIKEREFVTASKAMGATTTHIVFTHLLTNALPPLLILASLSLGYTILSIAALSFLGIGVQPPAPEWGTMLYNARTYFSVAPHLAIFPGASIFAAVSVFLAIGKSGNEQLEK